MHNAAMQQCAPATRSGAGDSCAYLAACRTCRSYTGNNYNTLWQSHAWAPSDTYAGGTASASVSTGEVDLTMDTSTGISIYTVKMRTFFVAPRAGPYTFLISADDYMQLNATYLDVSAACCCCRAVVA
jgi:hypothetical protein